MKNRMDKAAGAAVSQRVAKGSRMTLVSDTTAYMSHALCDDFSNTPNNFSTSNNLSFSERLLRFTPEQR